MSITNYEGLQITIRATEESGTYEFTAENKGNLTLWHIAFSTYELLGPGYFGLDDTHMPESLTNEELALIRCLVPGASVAFSRKKWGPLDRYRGPANGSLDATFSPHEDGEGRLGLRASFIILDVTPNRQIHEASHLSQHPQAFRFGKALGNLLGKLRGN